MPIFDYSCPCGHKEERIVSCCFDSQLCPECGKYLMDREFPRGTRFNLKYDNKTDMCDWSGNTSRYWDDVKKQKEEEGKFTMPVTDNIS